jgi:predicted glycoside hydrolase/deacetylase ChbG (UPF0249 family)
VTNIRPIIEKQLDLFEAHWGAPPDHVDGHQHVHQFAGIREPLLDVLCARYPARRPWLRLSIPVAGGFKGRVIAAMGARALQRAATDAGFQCTNALAGVYDFGGDESDYANRMDAWLRESADGTVLMCHPASEAPGDDEIGPAREREYRWLLGANFASMLSAHHVHPVPGTELFATKP